MTKSVCVLVDVADVVYGSAYGVQQSGAAADAVLPLRYGLHLVELHPVMEHLRIIVEEHC